jgi:hypothetical protein
MKYVDFGLIVSDERTTLRATQAVGFEGVIDLPLASPGHIQKM